MTTEEKIEMIEKSRQRMHEAVDEKYDEMIQCIRTGQPLQRSRVQRYDLNEPPFVFKGKKPISITYPNGEKVMVNTWREVAAELLRDCNSDPGRHEALMQLRYKVGGNTRWILADTDRRMDVGIKIDENLYFEGKFDTEYLLKMMTERIFDKVGYPYEMIEIEVRTKGQAMARAEEPEETVTMQML